MSAQTITIVSGIVLLLVFALVGWNLRRSQRGEQEKEKESQP
jgi:hypothetical protein